jgi:vacuolar protein sorting-associated protein 26
LPTCCPRSLFLSPYDLTPTYKDVHNKFSVRYFLNLVLVDEEDRRYFKQQEITLYRRAEVEGQPLLPGADATSRMSTS